MLGHGPVPARIMIVGDCFINDLEERAGQAFLGNAGKELDRVLHEARILRAEVYTTTVTQNRPLYGDPANLVATKKKDITPAHQEFRGLKVLQSVPDGYLRLCQEIQMVQPNIIVAVGQLALYLLTGAWGLGKWRGSQLRMQDWKGEGLAPKVIPTFPPQNLVIQQENRHICLLDMRRVAKECGSREYLNEPEWNFIVRPSHSQVLTTLDMLYGRLESGESLWLDYDLETRAGQIACAGISWTLTDAICIPMMCVENREGYWSLEEEAGIVFKLYQVLTHKNAKVRWQNGLYDAQYTYRHWHFIPNGKQDTMISHHTMFAGLPKRLDFQASMYCDHYIYWKDDGKTWTKDVGEDQLWSYNCVDCVRTREVGEVELRSIAQLGLQPVEDFQQRFFYTVLKTMNRGVRIDTAMRAKFAQELQDELTKREEYFQTVLGHALNPRSPKKMCQLFYDDLQQKPIKTRAKKGVPGHVTCDDEALSIIGQREPLLRPLLKAIAEYRSIGVFKSTFVEAKLDVDGRMRSSYNICGTETYRLSSSQNAFDSGANLQNIPKGTKAKEPEDLSLPNVRKLYIPDEGYEFFDMDLDRADLQVVVWEADDADLRMMLKMGVDLHIANGVMLAGIDVPMDELVDGHPNYQEHKDRYAKERQLAKAWVHGTNYGGSPRTMAIAACCSVARAEKMQAKWFALHPGILAWHKRTEEQLTKRRYVENRFGFRRYYFGRTDGLLPEALAWVPQSTVAVVIDKAWTNISENLPEVEVLMQVHDSLAGQYLIQNREFALRRLEEESSIVVPYDTPLIIPVGFNTSTKSWGDCKSDNERRLEGSLV